MPKRGALFYHYGDIALSPSPCFKAACAAVKTGNRTAAGVYLTIGAVARRRAKVFAALFTTVYPDDAHPGPVTYQLKPGANIDVALSHWCDHGVCLTCWHRAISAGECKHCGRVWRTR